MATQFSLAPVEYSEQRILTTEQLADFYECEPRRISENFNRNKERFVEFKHYYKLEGDKLNDFRENLQYAECVSQISPMTRTLYLWTKQGAACHAEIIGTENVWEVFKELYNRYFTVSMALEVTDIQGVRAYLDENGTAWLNVEDVARGLGFVMVREERVTTSGDKYEAVRWARVNLYLAEFGYSKTVGKDDFIPENMFYRLAMKAKNEAAEKFQAKVADEILPAIRKTGEYKSNKKQAASKTKELDEIILGVGKVSEAIRQVYAVKKGIALAQATNLVSDFYRVNLSPLKALIPPAEHETGYMNATQLGEKVGLTARAINQLLKEKGLQFKDGRDWRLTEKGKQFGEELPYDTGKHSGYQIRWGSPAAELFLEDVKH